MTILDCLKTAYSSRVSYGNKWLIVTEHTYHAKQSTCLLETDNEEKAVEELMR